MMHETIPADSWRDAGAGVYVLCPRCDRKNYLDHDIKDDGSVMPSVVCDCGYHALIKLDGWKPYK